MRRSLLISISCGIVLLGGVAFFVSQQPTIPQTAVSPDKTAPTSTIPQSPLATSGQVAPEKMASESTTPDVQYSEYGEPIVAEAPLAEAPAAIAALVQRLSKETQFTERELEELRRRFREWGVTGKDQAIDYALRSLSGIARLEAGVAAFDGWSTVDLSAAADYVGDLLVPQGDYLVYAVPARYVAKDVDAAIEWALGGTRAEDRYGAMQHTMLEWLRRDSESAASWVADHVTGRDRLHRYETMAVWEVVNRLAAQDLDSAGAYVNSLDSLPAQQTAVTALLDRWADTDLAAAGVYLQTTADAADAVGLFDQSFADMAMREVEVDPAGADRWLQQIADETMREEAETLVREKVRILQGES